MREIDEKARREQMLRDPRRDPTEPPPAALPAQQQEQAPHSTREAGATEGAEAEKNQAQGTDEPSSGNLHSTERAGAQAPDAVSVVTSADPRISGLEPLVAGAKWEAILTMLGEEVQADKLPPNLGLIYALAYKEHHVEMQSTTETKKQRDAEGYEPNAAVIRCMAGLFGVSAESPIAVVLGKRLIRSNPVSWQKKKAPPAHISVLIVGLGLLIGAGIGWLLSFGYVTFKLPSLPFLS